MLVFALAAILAAEAVPKDGSPRHPLLDFTLNETDQQLLKQFDRPPQVARGQNYFVLQFHALAPTIVEKDLPVEWLANTNNAACDGKFAYTAYFNGDGQLQSILHQPDRHLPANYLFPSGTYKDYEATNSVKVKFRYRVRSLPGDRILVTTFYQDNPKFLDQVVLVRRNQLPAAFPLLAPLLKP